MYLKMTLLIVWSHMLKDRAIHGFCRFLDSPMSWARTQDSCVSVVFGTPSSGFRAVALRDLGPVRALSRRA